MAGTSEAWLPEEGQAFRRAMASAGHTQQEAAVELERFGLQPEPSQASVSRWATGRGAPRPHHRPALRAYIDEYDGELQPGEADWSALVGGFSGEPLLGPRQANFVDAVVRRIESGPMTDAEVALLTRLAERLGVFRD